MLKKIALIPSLIFLTVMLTSGAEIPGTAVVIKTVENMYSASNDAVDVVSQALLGTNVKVLAAEKNAKGEEWFRIETPDTYQGWMIGTSLRPSEGAKSLRFGRQRLRGDEPLGQHLLADDVTKRKPLTVAPIGAVLEVGGTATSAGIRRGYLRSPAGRRLWVQKGDGEIRDAAAPRKKLLPDETVALAKRFLGLPYFWGGGHPLWPGLFRLCPAPLQVERHRHPQGRGYPDDEKRPRRGSCRAGTGPAISFSLVRARTRSGTWG